VGKVVGTTSTEKFLYYRLLAKSVSWISSRIVSCFNSQSSRSCCRRSRHGYCYDSSQTLKTTAMHQFAHTSTPSFRVRFCVPRQHTAKRRRKSARDNHVPARNFAKYSPSLKIIFTHRLSNKPFLIRLLTAPLHLKYAATLLCNLSIMACFADINVSQGSVTTYI